MIESVIVPIYDNTLFLNNILASIQSGTEKKKLVLEK